MKNWRPRGWDNSRDSFSKFIGGGVAENKAALEDFEAGADAILRGIKKQSQYLNGDTIIPASCGFPEIHCPGGRVGWLIFIEEEDEKNND